MENAAKRLKSMRQVRMKVTARDLGFMQRQRRVLWQRAILESKKDERDRHDAFARMFSAVVAQALAASESEGETRH